jgi:hypothetical protein
VHASLIASTIAALFAHTPNVKTQPPQAGAPRTEAPLPPRLLAVQLAVSCQSIAQAFELTGADATRRWNKIAELLCTLGKIPNWRRPSVLDPLRGWKRSPHARIQTSSRAVNPRDVKEAA